MLLVVCHDCEKHTACLVVLDAQNLQQIAVKRMPRNTYRFHCMAVSITSNIFKKLNRYGNAKFKPFPKLLP